MVTGELGEEFIVVPGASRHLGNTRRGWKTRWWKTCGLHLRHEKRNPGWGKPSQAGGQRGMTCLPEKVLEERAGDRNSQSVEQKTMHKV
mgnify:CR=1 FL=1